MLSTLDKWLTADVATRRAALVDVMDTARATSATTGAYIALADDDQVGASAADATGSWAAIPIVVKDNIDSYGFPTTAGTPALAHTEPPADAGAVHAVRSLGAIVIGKSNLHELAFGVTSNNTAYGAVRNPYDTSRVAGGSSGGSAALVARGDVPLSLGTDTGGSISLPAAFCGVAGFRPTTGRYPGDGVVHLTWTRDTVGLHTRTARDLLIADAAIVGRPRASLSADDARPLVVGISDEFTDDLDPAVAFRFGEVREALRAAGVRVVDVGLRGQLSLCAAWENVLVRWEAPRSLAAYLAEYADTCDVRTVEGLAATAASPDVIGILTSLHTAPATPAEYRRSLQVRAALRLSYAAALDASGADVLLMPTSPVLPPPISERNTVDHNGRIEPTFPTVARHTAYGSFIGAPMATIPTAGDGLPIGVTLQGRFTDDESVLEAAITLEAVLTPELVHPF